MSQSGLCPNHGTAWTGRPRGVRQVEVYYNTATIGSASCLGLTNLLGGTGRFLSNKVTNAPCDEFLGIDIPRFEINASPWNACDGTQPWDQYPWSSTTACIDQPGSGFGLLYSTANPPTLNPSPGTACAVAGKNCWPSPVSDPVYEAGDTATSSTANIVVNSSGAATRILANRDYFGEVSQSAQTSSTSPFNGTSGTGYGTLANRPTTCTTGVGYWATNTGTWNTYSSQQGTLYICTATNTWTVGYTPYTYPHPLDTSGGSLAAPTASPATGSYAITQTVTLSGPSGATICYTTNGTTPTATTPGTCSTGIMYSTPITVSSSLTLQAMSTEWSYTNSSCLECRVHDQ